MTKQIVVDAKLAIQKTKENIEKAKTIHNQLSSQMSSKMLSNEVFDGLSIIDNISVEMANKWETVLISHRNDYNIFEVEVEKGAVLPIHSHEKSDETIIILTGSVKRLGDFENSFDKREIIRFGEIPLFIPKGEQHGFVSLEDSKIIKIFKPPIQENYENNGS